MLGCTLYELCSLHKPFSGDSINAIVQKIMYEQPDPVPSKYSRFVIELVE
jgi:NIMA (never in mitosis gene a)-related kinase